MQLRSAVGVVELEALHGQDPTEQHWGCPVSEHWGLSQHQQLSLGLEDKLAFTVTATASYEEAAVLAQKWGSPVAHATLHALAQRLADGQFRFQLSRPVGSNYIIQASSDLAAWVLTSTNVIPSGFAFITDPTAAKYPQRFYRAVSR